MKTKFNFLTSVLCAITLLLCSFPALAQDIAVKGSVIDGTGEPLIGVSVTVKDRTGFGTTTDVDGNFKIKAPQGSTLVFSYVGYVTCEHKAAPP